MSKSPFLDQLATLGWTVIGQGHGLIPSDPTASFRGGFCEGFLPEEELNGDFIAWSARPVHEKRLLRVGPSPLWACLKGSDD